MDGKLTVDDLVLEHGFNCIAGNNVIKFMADNQVALELKEIIVKSGYKISISIMDHHANEFDILETITINACPETKGFGLTDFDKDEELRKNNPTIKNAWENYQKSKEMYLDLMKLHKGN